MSEASRAAAGWRAGVAAMLAMSAVMLVGRLSLGVSTLPEIFSDPVLYLIPAPLFAAALDLLRFAGKPFLLLVLFLGQLAVGALVGRYVGVSTKVGPFPPPGEGRSDREASVSILRPVLSRSLWTSTIIWVVTVTFLMPLLGVGFLGALTVAGTLATGLVYLVSFLTYGVCLAWVFSQLILTGKQGAPTVDKRRRAVLRRIGIGIAGLLGSSALVVSLDVVGKSGETTRLPAKLPSPITPVGGFYVVNKDLIGVKVDAQTWNLTVVGNGTGSKTFDLEDLKAMSPIELTTTLTCISNEIGGNLIGTARWTGVPLRDLLRAVGVGPGAYSVVASAWDTYADSIPIAKALDPNTLLVYAIDGKPLSDLHGFPLRMIVPGLYGIKNVKWIKRIEVLDHGFEGYWQARGWTDDATVQTQSQIDVPIDHAVFPSGPVSVGGIAFAGDRGIARVELSPDGGATWLPAMLQPPLSPLTWVTWTTLWTPAAPGWHRLTVRATDGSGQLQRLDVTPPIPDGATGYHSIDVRVG